MIKNKEIFKFFKNTKPRLVMLWVMYILLGIISFITPILTANLLAGLIYKDMYKVFAYAIYVALAFSLQELLLYITEFVWNGKVRPKLLYNVRHFVINNIFNLKMSVIDNYGNEAIETKINEEPLEMARVVNTTQKNIINVITKLGIVIYVILTDWRIAVIYLIGMITVAYIDNRKHAALKSRETKISNSSLNSSKYISEVVEGINDIKSLDIEETISSNLSTKLNNVVNNIAEKELLESGYTRLEKIVLYSTMAFIIIMGICFLEEGTLTVVNLLVMYLYQNDIFSLMNEITTLRTTLNEYNEISNKILKLEDNTKFEKEIFGKKELTDVKGKINFNSVIFGYDKTKPILKNMNFEIKPGETVALVGSENCGKSTIIKLLMRKYDLINGSITIDDIPINELTKKSLRTNISIVKQDSYIFNMSIKDNLLLVKPDATNKEIDEVCKKVDIYDYIISLPKKYNTIIGTDGVNLSGSQKQKIAIARALLKDSKILIFDEATSMIDSHTQSEMHEAITKIYKDLTVIVISQRLSTIVDCDRILVIDQGRVVAEGKHKNLITNCKIYKNMFKDVHKKIRL